MATEEDIEKDIENLEYESAGVALDNEAYNDAQYDKNVDNTDKNKDMSKEDFNSIVDILTKYNSNNLDNIGILLEALRKMGFENIKV